MSENMSEKMLVWNNLLLIGQSTRSIARDEEEMWLASRVHSRGQSPLSMGPGAISTDSLNELPGVGDFEARYNSHSHLQARFSLFQLMPFVFASFVFRTLLSTAPISKSVFSPLIDSIFFVPSDRIFSCYSESRPCRRGSTREKEAPPRGTPKSVV